MAMVLLLGFVAHRKGWSEVILGAFLAGAILNLVDRESLSHPNLRLKLEAIGYGFVVPVFFIASGPRFDLQALLDRPQCCVEGAVVPARLVAGAGSAGRGPRQRGRAARSGVGGLLQATSLPFSVTVTHIGLELGEVRPDAAAARWNRPARSPWRCFPPTALSLLRAGKSPAGSGADAAIGSHVGV